MSPESSEANGRTTRTEQRSGRQPERRLVSEANGVNSAEGGGFEPPGPARARWFSRPVHSSALPSLQGFEGSAYAVLLHEVLRPVLQNRRLSRRRSGTAPHHAAARNADGRQLRLALLERWPSQVEGASLLRK